jgi:hypothetical protein
MRVKPKTARVRAALVVTALAVAPQTSGAIRVDGDRLFFTPSDEARRRSDAPLVSEVIAFHEEIQFGRHYPTADPYFTNVLLGVVNRRVIQGVKFTVSKSEEFAVVLSYFCTMEEVGAMFPFACEAVAWGVDANGTPLGHISGDFLHVETHDYLDYFLVMIDTCCDGPVRSKLVTIAGEEVCSITDHRDHQWAKKTEFICIDESLSESVIVNLEGRLRNAQ